MSGTAQLRSTVPKRYVFIIVPAVVILTLGFYWCYNGENRLAETIKMGGTFLGIGAAILGTIYVGKTLEHQLESKNEEVRTRREERSLEFIRRWNDLRLLEPRRRLSILREKFVTNGANVEEILHFLREHDLGEDLKSVLNFFEEVAIAIRQGAANEKILRDAFRSVALTTHKMARSGKGGSHESRFGMVGGPRGNDFAVDRSGFETARFRSRSRRPEKENRLLPVLLFLPQFGCLG